MVLQLSNLKIALYRFNYDESSAVNCLPLPSLLVKEFAGVAKVTNIVGA
jgi:hypothetical protein